MNLGKLNLRFDRFGKAFIDHKKEVSQQVIAIYVLRTLPEANKSSSRVEALQNIV